MYQSQINVRYAKSLFLLAEEKKVLEKIKTDIEFVLRTFQEFENIQTLLDHPVVKASQKRGIIGELFKNKVGKETMSFLQLIIKNKRENHLKYMCKDFIEIYRKHKGIRTAVLTTAYKLSEEEKLKIRTTIEDKFKANIELQDRVDERLIGGMIIQVDDKQLDLSVAKQIHQLSNQFQNIDFNNRKKKK